MFKTRRPSLFLAVALLAVAPLAAGCGAPEQVVANNQAAVQAASDSICSAQNLKVYKYQALPGTNACACATLSSTDSGTSKSNLFVYYPDQAAQRVTLVSKGNAAFQWNDTWTLAGCP